jgi:hypothetical protein
MAAGTPLQYQILLYLDSINSDVAIETLAFVPELSTTYVASGLFTGFVTSDATYSAAIYSGSESWDFLNFAGLVADGQKFILASNPVLCTTSSCPSN